MNTTKQQIIEHLKEQYLQQENCMGDFLAFISVNELPSDLSVEDVFEIYIALKKWADGDSFLVSICDEKPKEIGVKPSRAYRHLGYYNSFADVKYLCEQDADAVVEYMKGGYGAFHSTDGSAEDFTIEGDQTIEDVQKNEPGVHLTKDGKYLVNFYDCVPVNILADADGDCSCFIDVYELREQ